MRYKIILAVLITTLMIGSGFGSFFGIIETVKAGGGIIFSFDSPGPDPFGLAWDDDSSGGPYLWHADDEADKIYKLDPSDGSVVDWFFSPGPHPRGLAWDDDSSGGPYLWCSIIEGTRDRIYKLDPSDGSVVDWFFGPGVLPGGLAWDDDSSGGPYLWYVDWYVNDKIYKLDPSDGSVVDWFDSPGSYPMGLTWDGSHLWNADWYDDKIYKLDPSDGSVVDWFDSPGSYPYGLAWDGTYLWNADGWGDKIYKLDVIANQNPVADFTWSPSSSGHPQAGEIVTFTSTSYDPDGYIDIWAWDFDYPSGDDAHGEVVTHVYTEPGTYDVKLWVRDNDGGTDSIHHDVTVYPAPPQLAYSPSTIHFGSHPQGWTGTETFDVWNSGGGTLTFSVDSSHIDWITVNPTSGTSTGPSNVKTIQVYVHDTEEMEGYYPDNIHITSNGGNGDVFVDITIYEKPEIQLTPPDHDFEQILIGEESDEFTFTLKNIGGGTAVGDVSLTGTHANQFFITEGGEPFSLNEGETKPIKVEFRPTSEGNKNAGLLADLYDSDNDDESYLYGEGIPSPPHLELTPQTANYSDTYVGETSPPQYFTLTNTGGTTATGNIYLINSDHFTITNGGGPFTLEPNDPRTIEVKFTPTTSGQKTTILKAEGTNCYSNTSTLTGYAINHPPNTPTIDGPTYGYLGINLPFTVVTTDPDGDQVHYRIDWDDGTPLEWIGAYPSGINATVVHNWTTTGSKNITAQAKDINEDESSWSDPYTVTIYDPDSIPHYAVVIGEWDYPGSDEDIIESLCNAYSINAFLENTNEWTNTIYQTNRGADGIIDDLTWMKDQENETSISLFYYSGHGRQILDDDGDEADGLDEALYCSDENTIRDDDLKDLLDQFEGPVVVILESCNSGGFGELEGDNIVIMTACNETEDSHIGGGMLSVFTNYIGIGWNNGEADVNGDDKITDEETFIYARDNTLNYAQGQPWWQTPQLFDGYGGEIPLIISGFGENMEPDIPTDPIPYDGAEDIPLETELSCIVTDPDQDNLIVGFFWEDGARIGLDTDVNSGDRANITVSDLYASTTYNWYVLSSDGMDVTASPTWSFTTELGDIIPPQWQNQGQNKTTIQPGESISLYAQGKDETALDWAWLATNETGVWQNFTGESCILTIRPTGAGTYTELDIGGSNPPSYNWEAVDEVTANDNVDYVYTDTLIGGYKYDTYTTGASYSDLGTITSVTIYFRSQVSSVTQTLKTAILTHSTLYTGDFTVATSWVTNSKTYTTNPYTGAEWTWDEINNLEIGVSLKPPINMCHCSSYCTQVYAEVNYTLTGTASKYDSPMKMQENDQWQWSNFTWQNASIPVGTTVGWRIYYNDTSGNVNCTDIMSFTIGEEPNDPPMFSNENPNDGAIDVSITLSELTVTIEDLEGDSFDWTIETSPDIGSSSGTGEGNGTKNCTVPGLDYNTTYTWYVNATDPSGSREWTREIYTFTTKSLPEPDLECEGELNWEDVEPGGTVEGSFTVENVGEDGSELDWEITEWPEWGNWTFDSDSGTGLTPEDDPVTVEVEVVAPDEQNQEFTGEVTIVNSDDPSDYCTIPVSLTTRTLNADLDCEGSLSWNNVEPGSTVTDYFTVENVGDPGSELDWEIESWPSWGDWTFTPPSGEDLTPEEGAATIGVSVVAPDDPNTEFTGEVKVVNSNDPSDYEIIPVYLKTPVNQDLVDSWDIYSNGLEEFSLSKIQMLGIGRVYHALK